MKTFIQKSYDRFRSLLLFTGVLVTIAGMPMPAYAGDVCGGGSGETGVKTSIDIGCVGKGNSIADMAFAVIRLLSMGVGLIVVASIVVAGIQYTTSKDDPKATAAAETRIKSAVTALLIYIFGYAILNYVLPAGFLK